MSLAKYNKKVLSVIVILLIVVFSFIFSFALQGENPLRSLINIRSTTAEDIDANISYVSHEYEVTNIYRMYDGYNLIYGVDYIDDNEIKTLVAPDFSRSDSAYNCLTIYPSNSTYLIYLEEIHEPSTAIVTITAGDRIYELYISDNFTNQGVPTSYTRPRQSDFHSTVIVT